MDSERWQRIGEIFEAVSGLSGTALDEALARCCASAAALAHEVRSLLEADQDSEPWPSGLMVRARIPAPAAQTLQIGLASFRESICPYSYLALVAVPL